MAASARVKYKIVKCTSEDSDYPVSELLAHSSQTRGWQTARFCEYPQEIGLQFESPVHLRQVQFLSHQSKIATKIELFTSLPGENCRYEAATFKRLGYLSLDSNERSQFQARELKSVYVDVSAQYLRIILHKCHVNRYNVVNQVGLIALHCSGEVIEPVLSPDLAVGPPASIGPPGGNPALARQRQNDLREEEEAALAAREAAQLQKQAKEAELAKEAREAAIREAPVAPTPDRQERKERLERPPRDRQERQQPRAEPPRAVEQPRADTRVVEPPPSEQASDGHSPEETQYDARTLERLQALTSAKERAVEAEDYAEAKRCKEMLDRLRQSVPLLRELEERKLAAVQNEDFDTASSLKAEIERLRSSVENSQSNSESRDRIHARVPSGEQGFPAADGRAPATQTAPRGGHQSGYDNFGGAAGGQRPGSGSQGRLQASSPEPSPTGRPRDDMYGAADYGGEPDGRRYGAADYGGEPGGRGSAMAFSPYYDESSAPGPGPPTSFDAVGGSMRGGSPPLPGGGMQPRGGYGFDDVGGGGPGGGGFGGDNGSDRDPQGSSELAYHLRGVPNIEDILASPEPLSAIVEKEKECMQLVQLFGDYITRCIYSKTWSLRDAALQKLALDLREGARAGDDPNFLLQGYCAILKRTVADKNVQVSLSSAGVLQAVAQVLLDGGQVRRSDAQPTLEPIMVLLVERLGEANARIDKTARDALLDFARCQSVGASFTTQYLLRPPKKKTGAAVHARVYTSRLQALTALATDFGVQPESRDGVPLEATAKLAMDWFNNKDGDVRENSVKLVAACYLHVGPRRIEGYLANLRPAQREVFDAEFERVSGCTPSSQARAQIPSRGAPRMDDASGDPYGGMPCPQVPPRRNGNSAQYGGYQQEEAAEFVEEDVPEFTCQFCLRQDPHFTPDNLDVHYWRECPMLIQCEFCQQVIEISALRSHLLEECEVGFEAQEVGRAMAPNQCPLCRADAGRGEMEDWREHLLSVGCPRNTRSTVRRGGSSYGQR